MCGRSERPKPCCICGRAGGKLCDYPLRGEKEGKTCDRSLCARCAVHSASHDIDLCPSHAALANICFRCGKVADKSAWQDGCPHCGGLRHQPEAEMP